jgi:hypothetical protein
MDRAVEFCYQYVMEKHINQMKPHLNEESWNQVQKNVSEDIESYFEEWVKENLL